MIALLALAIPTSRSQLNPLLSDCLHLGSLSPEHLFRTCGECDIACSLSRSIEFGDHIASIS